MDELEILVLAWCLEVLEGSFEIAKHMMTTDKPSFENTSEQAGYAGLNGMCAMLAWISQVTK